MEDPPEIVQRDGRFVVRRFVGIIEVQNWPSEGNSEQASVYASWKGNYWLLEVAKAIKFQERSAAEAYLVSNAGRMEMPVSGCLRSLSLTRLIASGAVELKKTTG